MRRFAFTVSVVLCVLCLAMPALAGSNGSGFKIEGLIWPSSTTATSGSGSTFATWSTFNYGARFSYRPPNGGLSFHAEYLTGSQSGQTGSWANSTGTDKLFLAYTSLPVWSANGSAVRARFGYGKYGWDTTFSSGAVERLRHSGLMFGLSASTMLAPNLRLHAGVNYFPFNTVTFSNGSTDTSTSTMLDFSVGARWRLSPLWTLDTGYRKVKASIGNNPNCPDCRFHDSGFFLGVGSNF